MEENLKIYNQLRTVPKEAQKKITGGRLNGMTDIKPMWRIEKLTEVFGMCGIGWKAPIKNKEIIEGANGEKIAVVDIELYVKVNGEWSEAIEGTGGSSFIAKEKNGLYTSDECFKMAYTDAISVACKSLGMGADVYWGDSKYATKEITTKEEALKYEITFGKHNGKTLGDLYAEEEDNYIDWLWNNSKDETLKQCISIIDGRRVYTEEEQKEILKLMTEINKLAIEKKVDFDEIRDTYDVKSSKDMTLEELRDCVEWLKNVEKGE